VVAVAGPLRKTHGDQNQYRSRRRGGLRRGVARLVAEEKLGSLVGGRVIVEKIVSAPTAALRPRGAKAEKAAPR